MSRDAWDEFSNTILVGYVLSYLCGTLYLDSSVSFKRSFAFSVDGLFSLSTHALTCLSLLFLFVSWAKLHPFVLVHPGLPSTFNIPTALHAGK